LAIVRGKTFGDATIANRQSAIGNLKQS